MLEPPPDYEEASVFSTWITESVRLYNRCNIFGKEISLPSEGGLLEQNELILRILETIHEEVENFKKKKLADEDFKIKFFANINSGGTNFRR